MLTEHMCMCQGMEAKNLSPPSVIYNYMLKALLDMWDVMLHSDLQCIL